MDQGDKSLKMPSSRYRHKDLTSQSPSSMAERDQSAKEWFPSDEGLRAIYGIQHPTKLRIFSDKPKLLSRRACEATPQSYLRNDKTYSETKSPWKRSHHGISMAFSQEEQRFQTILRFSPLICEPFSPLQPSKTPKTPNLSKICPGNCWGVPVRGTEI